MPVNGAIRFAEDADVLRFYPDIEKYWPRTDKKTGLPKRDWNVQHQLAMDEIERRLRARKSTSEPIELGRLGIRTKERLRDCAACFALYFMFTAMDTHGDETGFFSGKATSFLRMAEDRLEDESIIMDYDADNSGTIDDSEKNQPLPQRFIRG